MRDTGCPLHDHPPPDLAAFYAWLDQHGVIRHDGLSVKDPDDGSGWGVYSTQDIRRGQVLCAIPRDLILSAQTASLRPTEEVEDYAGFVLQLASCLLHELRLGNESMWYPWLQILPRETICIPTLWAQTGEDGQKGLDWLQDTEAARELDKKHGEGLSLADLEAYHARLDLPPTKSQPLPPSLQSFFHAYSLVSSRGFVIDSYHSVGLIPYCDMFNHSSTASHTSLSVDPAVCEICGSLLACSHDASRTPDRLAHLAPSYLIQLEEQGLADKVDMRAQRDIQVGSQVLSCYDEDKRNASLLVEYGFIDDDRNTTVTWGYREVLTPETLPVFVSIIQQFDMEQSARRYDLIGEFMNDQPEPLQIRSTGAISLNLFVALYLRYADPDAHDVPFDRLRGIVKEIRDAHGSPPSQEISQTAKATIESVIDLVTSRLDGLRQADTPLSDLQDLYEAMPLDRPLERLGLQAMLSERKLLEKCLAMWTTLSVT